MRRAKIVKEPRTFSDKDSNEFNSQWRSFNLRSSNMPQFLQLLSIKNSQIWFVRFWQLQINGNWSMLQQPRKRRLSNWIKLIIKFWRCGVGPELFTFILPLKQATYYPKTKYSTTTNQPTKYNFPWSTLW